MQRQPALSGQGRTLGEVEGKAGPPDLYFACILQVPLLEASTPNSANSRRKIPHFPKAVRLVWSEPLPKPPSLDDANNPDHENSTKPGINYRFLLRAQQNSHNRSMRQPGSLRDVEVQLIDSKPINSVRARAYRELAPGS